LSRLPHLSADSNGHSGPGRPGESQSVARDAANVRVSPLPLQVLPLSIPGLAPARSRRLFISAPGSLIRTAQAAPSHSARRRDNSTYQTTLWSKMGRGKTAAALRLGLGRALIRRSATKVTTLPPTLSSAMASFLRCGFEFRLAESRGPYTEYR
jgi:hypothetical protein